MSEEMKQEMNAIVLANYSADFNETLNFQKIEKPKESRLGANEMIVKVHYCSSNPIDYKVGLGHFQLYFRSSLPRPILFDIAGVVVAKGANCVHEIGSKVFGDLGSPFGSAEYVRVPDSFSFAQVPSDVGLDEAAAVPLAALTSLQSLRQAGCKKGSKVVIRGASGGTGTFAIQIAKILGASEIVAISSATELCTKLGATKVVNYKTDAYEQVLAGNAYDVFYDCVGGYDCWVKARDHILQPRGYFVTIAGDKQDALSVGKVAGIVGATINRNFWSFVSSAPSYWSMLRVVSQADMQLLASWMREKKLTSVLDEQSPFPFTKEGAVAMFERQRSGKARGKLIMKVFDDDDADE